MTDTPERVAVLGTGIMGSAMTRNLVAAGLNVVVWDQSAEATAALAGAGARCPRQERPRRSITQGGAAAPARRATS
jgi:3-hydroxyisobutyrate dehydrogenase-like beta-hydroxyacid dehydrogenase